MWVEPATRRAAAPFVFLGSACVIGGGLASAATAPSATLHSAWAVAYLVLVAGVAQIVLGIAQVAMAATVPPRLLLGTQLATWNVGNAAVLVGTLTNVMPLTDLGGALLVVALALVLAAIRAGRGGRAATVLRLLVLLLLVSIPVGLVLQAADH
jgi:hypothetical protein